MKRVGGIGSILYTLFLIVDVEYSWVCGLQGKPEPEEPLFWANASLLKVRELSTQYHKEVGPFVTSWTNEMEFRNLTETVPRVKRLASGMGKSCVILQPMKSTTSDNCLYGHVKLDDSQ